MTNEKSYIRNALWLTEETDVRRKFADRPDILVMAHKTGQQAANGTQEYRKMDCCAFRRVAFISANSEIPVRETD